MKTLILLMSLVFAAQTASANCEGGKFTWSNDGDSVAMTPESILLELSGTSFSSSTSKLIETLGEGDTATPFFKSVYGPGFVYEFSLVGLKKDSGGIIDAIYKIEVTNNLNHSRN